MSESVVVAATETSRTTLGAERHAATRGRARSRFYAGMSGMLLLIVLAGFSRTLYLRAFFDVPEIPAYVALHGIVLTAWFVGVFFRRLSSRSIAPTFIVGRAGLVRDWALPSLPPVLW